MGGDEKGTREYRYRVRRIKEEKRGGKKREQGEGESPRRGKWEGTKEEQNGREKR